MDSNRPQKKIKVLIVEDSKLVQWLLVKALNADPGIEVVGSAGDPYEAREKIKTLRPDVLTLDVEMPRMDGLTFLRLLQQEHPIPVIVISYLTEPGSKAALAALDAGAVDVVGKPGDSNTFAAEDLAWRIKGAASAVLRPHPVTLPDKPVVPKAATVYHPDQLLLIGCSTGGIDALSYLLPRLPPHLPPICITQHLPAYISKSVAARLASMCPYKVVEAQDGAELDKGMAVIAPGDFHMTLIRRNNRYCVRLSQEPKVNFCRPSVDVMFSSAVSCSNGKAVAVLLTGMGNDGANGMKALHQGGAITLAQDEQSCVVFGMPRAAIALKAVTKVAPLSDLPGFILKALAQQA